MRAQIGNYDALAELRERLPADFMRWHPLSQSQYLESAYLLPGYILSSQGDRVGMANAVEGRFPFLDHRLIELAARIPPRLKLKGLVEKHILRQSMKDMLPADRSPRGRSSPTARRRAAPSCAPAPPHPCWTTCRPPTSMRRDTSSPSSSSGWCRSARALPSTGFRDNLAFVGILSTQVWHETFVLRR